MTVAELRADLDNAGARLAVDGDQLRVIAPPGVLTPEVRQAIRDQKPALIEALTGFRPLDPAISESEASRRPLHEIERRLARVTERAGNPAATALDRQLARDWTAIRDAKLTATGAAPSAA